MDLSDMYENGLNQEKERNKTITIEIAGMNLEIPEELVKERMERMYIDTMEENLEDIKQMGEAFFECFKQDKLKKDENFRQQFIDYLDESMEVLRP